jgi:hypothetical protein
MAQLTSKELTALEEQLTEELGVISKFKMYAQTSVDSELKNKWECIASKHQNHYDTLITSLKG